jgi:hypothetical protein
MPEFREVHAAWRQCVLPKRWYPPTRQHGITIDKATIYISWLRYLVVFLSFSRHPPIYYLKISHDHFPLHPTHNAKLWYWERAVKNQGTKRIYCENHILVPYFMTPTYILVVGAKVSGDYIASIFRIQHGDRMFLLNIGTHLPNFMVS